MSALLWILQRASGLLLVALAGVHLSVQHGLFPVPFRPQVVLAIDWCLLAVVLYHGLNGLRTVAYDYIGRPGAQRAVNWVLWTSGLALFLYGSWGLTAFVR